MRELVLYGVPFSAGVRPETSFSDDQRRAPSVLRRALSDLMSGFNIPIPFEDRGDINIGGSSGEVPACPDVHAVLSAVERTVAGVLSESRIPILVGGSHTLTLGSLRALKKHVGSYTLIYFDAHPDLMPHPEINYGSSLRYAVTEGVLDPARLVLLGLRQVEQEEWAFIKERRIFSANPLSIAVRGVAALIDDIRRSFPPPYYVSVDLDGIDPAFAPGVTTPFPIGLSPREVLAVVTELCRDPIVGLEVVELAPSNDRNEETARLAGALIYSAANAVRGG